MPNDLLDLSLEQVNAVIAGYSEREFDMECHCILTGYYTGYYMGAKRPKKPSDIIKKLMRARSKSTKRNLEAPDVDFFQQMESKFARGRLEELKNAQRKGNL